MSTEMRPLQVQFANSNSVRARCRNCEHRFKVYAEQDGKRVRCPKCSAAYLIVDGEDPNPTKPRRLWIWVALIAIVSFVAGYFAGREHFRYLVIETLRDMELRPQLQDYETSIPDSKIEAPTAE